MNKKRFLFASVDSPPRIGGVSLLAHRVSQELTNHHASESVYVGPRGTYFGRGDEPCKLYEDFQSDTKFREGKGSLREDIRIQDLFSSIIKGYRLDQLILWHPFYYGVGALGAARQHNIPCSVFVHGTELTSQIGFSYDDSYEFVFDPASVALKHRLYATLSEADQILTNSTYSASLISRVVPGVKLNVVGCGIKDETLAREVRHQPEYDPLSKKMFREDLALPERKTLIQVGRLVGHKNNEMAIKLVSHAQNLQLIIVGDGPHRTKLEGLVESLNLNERVFFKGQVDDEEKWALMRAADAGILVSSFDENTGGYEGFGIAMIEYAAACCLVVSTGEYGMFDFARRYNGAKIVPAREDAIAETAVDLESALNDVGFMREQIRSTRGVVSRRYTWRKVAQRISNAL